MDLSHLSWSWILKSNRSSDVIRSERFHVPVAGLANETVICLDSVISRVRIVEKSKPMLGNSYFILIRGVLKEDCSWADAGHEVVAHQFAIAFDFGESVTSIPSSAFLSSRSERLEIIQATDKIEVFRIIEGATFALASINRESGALTSFFPHGRNVLHSPLLPHFVRAATDNDKGGIELTLDFLYVPKFLHKFFQRIRGIRGFSHFSNWKVVGLDGADSLKVDCERVRVTDSSSSAMVGIVALLRILSPDRRLELFKVKLHYTIFDDGRVRIAFHVVPQSILHTIPSLPRVGSYMQINQAYYDIQYYGKGPGENYPDRKSGSEMGVYETTPSDMAYLKYIVPSENGSRSDCEYIAFRSQDGDGFIVASTDQVHGLSKFSCNAQLHSTKELHEAMHTNDLGPRKDGEHPIHVCIDHALMGLGGDNSWFPVVYPEFLVKPQNVYQYDLWLLPLKKDENASFVARNFLAYET